MRKLFIGVPLLALFTVGCGGKPTGSTCPTGSTLTYDNFGKAFFAKHCAGCHASTGSGKPEGEILFDTVEQIRAHSTEIDLSTAGGPDAINTGMPEGSSPTEAERKQLGEWLACGAK